MLAVDSVCTSSQAQYNMSSIVADFGGYYQW